MRTLLIIALMGEGFICSNNCNDEFPCSNCHTEYAIPKQPEEDEWDKIWHELKIECAKNNTPELRQGALALINYLKKSHNLKKK